MDVHARMRRCDLRNGARCPGDKWERPPTMHTVIISSCVFFKPFSLCCFGISDVMPLEVAVAVTSKLKQKKHWLGSTQDIMSLHLFK